MLRGKLLSLCFMSAAVFLIGTSGAESITSDADLSDSRTVQFESQGPTIDSISIDNRNIFDLTKPSRKRLIYRLANALHFRTRKNVINRELLFDVGRSYPTLLGEETARNLRSRLQLYNSWIELDTLPNGHVHVKVVTVDEWTLSLGPSFSREGDNTRWEFALVERNLLGRNQELQLRYVTQTSEDDYYSTEFKDPRLFGQNYNMFLRYSGNPFDKHYSLTLGRPYYNLNQTFSFSTSIKFTDGRQDVYNDETKIAESYQSGDNFNLTTHWRTGSYQRKIGLTGYYGYRFEKTFDQLLLSTDSVNQEIAVAALPFDSAYHFIGAGINFSDVHFVKMKQIDGFDNIEDFTLGNALALTYGRTFDSQFDKSYHDNLTITLAQGHKINSTLLYLNLLRQSWFNGSSDFRRVTSASIHIYSTITSYFTSVVKATYLSDWRVQPVEGLTLGNGSGLRGFDVVFKTGDRLASLNIEGRFFPKFSILSARFGPVLFSDIARTFKPGDRLSAKDYYVNVGVSVRIAPEHSSREKLFRVDLDYSEVIGWQISIGTDQYFKARHATLRLTSP